MNPSLDPFITAELNPVEERLHGSLLSRLEKDYREWLKTNAQSIPSQVDVVLRWLEFLKLKASQEQSAWDDLHHRYAEFHRAWTASDLEADRREHILSFASELGAAGSDLKQDRAAFARWFDIEAVTGRYRRRLAQHEFTVAFVLGRLAAAATHALETMRQSQEQSAFWHWLKLEDLLQSFLTHEGDARLRREAFRCLATVLRSLNPELREIAIDDSTLQFIYRSALHSRQDVWIQCAALELLSAFSLVSFEQALSQRLNHAVPGDDLFVRRRAVQLLGLHFDHLHRPLDLIPPVMVDPSPFVRQALAPAMLRAPTNLAANWLRMLCLEDTAPEVRASAVLEIPALAAHPELGQPALALLCDILRRETHEFVLRVACRSAELGAAVLAEQNHASLAVWSQETLAVLEHLHVQAPSLKVRRWSAQAREAIWTESDPAGRELKQKLSRFIRQIGRGKTSRLSRRHLPAASPEMIVRVCAVLAREDYDYQLSFTRRCLALTRGHVFGFRWWRWWHEFRHPSPDKRQAFPHTIGRLFHTQWHVPSAILAELAQTKVPGEPLYIPEEDGWRPYLPLMDEILSSLEGWMGGRTVRIITAEGTTTIAPPRGWARLPAFFRLVWNFKSYAEKRNWRESTQEDAASYIRILEQLGFRIRFEGHSGPSRPHPSMDPAVKRFFPAVMVPVPLVELWDRMSDYFFSLYQNSIQELGIFILGFVVLFFGLHLWSNFRLRQARRRIPLVVGGWGTRGKSGTERLKAALFNAAGYGLVSKTTGCEAMFLQAYPFGEMAEMFLFRPYDKATIWEQANVVRIAARLETDVLLWECMGLTPSYVRILQHRWMRDDYSTITNTYPDHEDIQGPAGINIPEVIGCFIPERSVLVTSEEQMFPILGSIAESAGTRVYRTTWLEAGLIPSDILQRYPYEEHPNNIALVLSLAERLGIERDFALKETADRVVPDLGVLKTYPTAILRSRKLEFTNGMSANERFGTLSNWTRTGFDRQNYLEESGVWLTTVVNNRADRVPRSQVFARILVNDISADRHVLIGGNLNGLLGYIREAWAERASTLSLWKDQRTVDSEHGLRILEQQAIRLRLPIRAELVQKHLRVMLQSLPNLADIDELATVWDRPSQLQKLLEPFGFQEIQTAIVQDLDHDLRLWHEYQALQESIRQATPSQGRELDREFRQRLQSWFESKFIVVEDYFATGDQIIEIIALNTPPGYLNRVMGIQNIKGTGLDFVYRWQAWQACYNLTRPFLSHPFTPTSVNLQPLAAFHDYGLLSEEHMRQLIDRLRRHQASQSPDIQHLIGQIESHLDAALLKVRDQMKGTGSNQGFIAKLTMIIEEFLDASDAIRRRKTADQIYRDLVNERIGRQRAALELQALNQRQKGGWLLKKLQTSKRPFLRRLSGSVQQ